MSENNNRGMTQVPGSGVTLKEYFDARLNAVEALQKKDIDAIWQHFRSMEAALLLQAKEYERRLDALNGEQTRIAEAQRAHVSRELWDSVTKDTANWRAGIDLKMTELTPRTEFAAFVKTTDDKISTRSATTTGQLQGLNWVKTGVGFILGLIFSGIIASAVVKNWFH